MKHAISAAAACLLGASLLIGCGAGKTVESEQSAEEAGQASQFLNQLDTLGQEEAFRENPGAGVAEEAQNRSQQQ